ncbi:MAG: pyridoxal phosphate-dependent aminotransferase [Planctomycetes bacterium]|nr:pyridoxal phosphate-dependent aminotransferase [Planctomycetota bacterium]
MPSEAIAARVAEAIGSASFIREMFERGRRLKAEFGDENVFDLSLGNPTATPPQAYFDAIRAVAAEFKPVLHRYMPNSGFDETKAAVARFLTQEYKQEIDPAGVIMTSGAAGGVNVVLRAICNPGDEIIVLAPYFPEYRFYIEQTGASMVLVQTDDHFQPDLAAIERAITPRTRAVLINSPNNPTGAVYSAQACRGLAELLNRHDRDDRPLYCISDDPYRRILYDLAWCPTPIGTVRRGIIVSSYSKDLSVAGERAGYIAIPPPTPERPLLLSAMTMLNRTLGYVNMAAFMQRVVARCASACCDTSGYRENRRLLCEMLHDLGYELEWPQGAIYAFPRTPIGDDLAFVDILTRHLILAVPGRGFGRPGFIRLSFAVETKVIERSAGAFRAAREEALARAESPAACRSR